jgi:hypothetical protein
VAEIVIPGKLVAAAPDALAVEGLASHRGAGCGYHLVVAHPLHKTTDIGLGR